MFPHKHNKGIPRPWCWDFFVSRFFVAFSRAVALGTYTFPQPANPFRGASSPASHRLTGKTD